MGFFEKFRHKTQENVQEPARKEGRRNFGQTPEDVFRAYMKYFSFTKEELQQPLLDIGSGNGSFIEYVREVLGNKEAYGIEKQSARVSPLREGMVVGDGLSLPFGDETFEMVIAKDYFPLFVVDEKNMEQVIIEALRVLRPGGKMLGNISTPEGEIQKRDEDTRDERSKAWLDKRREGAEKLEVFLRNIRDHGYKVDYKEGIEKGSRKIIVTIQKP
jgi:ubiquinone/menaquinone biosynthesis C-methylase UbiE